MPETSGPTLIPQARQPVLLIVANREKQLSLDSYIHGETDELGFEAIRDPVTHFDYHATLLHLFGLDHHSLVFERSTRQESLTDGQPAKVVNGILKKPVA